MSPTKKEDICLATIWLSSLVMMLVRSARSHAELLVMNIDESKRLRWSRSLTSERPMMLSDILWSRFGCSHAGR